MTIGWRNSPTLEALRERILAAREMGRAAGAPPDPMAGFALTGMNRPGGQLGRDPMAVAAFELSQSLTVPGKLKSRRAAAGAEGLVLEAQLESARRTLAAEIRGGYARLFAMQREASALRAAKEILQLLIAGATARYTTGDGDLAMPEELQIERSRLEGQLDDLAVERSEAVARLNALLDRPAETPIRAADPLPSLGMRIPEDEAERTTLAARAVEHSPEVRMARAEVEAATRRLHAARLARWPDLLVGGEFGYRRELDPMVTARVGVELPLWKGKKQEAEVRAAEHDLRAAEEELRGAEARVRSEAASMLLRLAVSDRQMRRYAEEILPTSSLVIEARRTAYQTGRGGARELLEATRMLLMAESESARRQADRYEAMAQWEAMAGASSGTEGESR